MTFRELFSDRGPLSRERTSRFLLISIVSFFVLAPLLENRELGRIVLILNLYFTLVSATMQLAAKRILFLSSIPIAAASMILLLVSHFRPLPALMVANDVVLAAFTGFVAISMFIYLGHGKGSTNLRLTVSVTLYFMIGMTWFAIYNVVNSIQPGSLAEAGTPIMGEAHWSTYLYFSMVTLTTLGYGDIVAVRPAARMFAVLEATAGVLYIAITVARLVGAAHSASHGEKE